MTVTLIANAQTSLINEQQDTLINVIGYFCKNDTMTYAKVSTKAKVENGDTTLTQRLEESFMLIVRDSTSNGYTMEYKPLGAKCIKAENEIMQKLYDVSCNMFNDVSAIFTTDVNGTIKDIVNWREIRDKSKAIIKVTLDSLYASTPQLDTIMPRFRFENAVTLELSTESKIKEAYDELTMLFGCHGYAFSTNQITKEGTTNGYPSISTSMFSYTVPEEEYDAEGDYEGIKQTIVKIPFEDAFDLGFANAMQYLNEDVSSSLGDIREKTISMMKEKAECATLTILNANAYFDNGWPKSAIVAKSTNVGIQEQLESTIIEWDERSWYNYK